MARRVFECLTYDTASATCTQSAWVERAEWELSVADAMVLLTAIALCWAVAWGWSFVGDNTHKG